MSTAVTVADRLEWHQVEAVESLLAAAEAADGTPPVNEAGRLLVRHARTGVHHLLLAAGPDLLGYGQLEDGIELSTAQLVVTPPHRRRGHGRVLLERLLTEAVSPLQIWAMGDSPAARRLAHQAGLTKARELLVMKRLLDDTLGGLAAAPVPAGVQIRAFRPGVDDAAWLAVNAAAFAHHPEQGQMTQEDLDQRMAEDWFDPAGFLVAETAEEMVGFHWTKQHQDHLGEVYVLGVSPTMGGRGLGKALLGAGLHHLRDRGNTAVELYVEADHAGAVGLYRAYGFVVASRDVMYREA
jgi:mycothiol synthase